jgi:surface antigen
MTPSTVLKPLASRASILLVLLLSLTACGNSSDMAQTSQMSFASVGTSGGVDPERRAYAVAIAKEMRSYGKRVWCVPFARNASGVVIQGNANTWWAKAKGTYDRDHKPKVGAVMAFSATRKLPMGHVAMVSEIVSEREIKIDHANWHRNKVSLGMTVVDVSKANDWSQVRVASYPNQLGRVYPVSGFISKPVRTASK